MGIFPKLTNKKGSELDKKINDTDLNQSQSQSIELSTVLSNLGTNLSNLGTKKRSKPANSSKSSNFGKRKRSDVAKSKSSVSIKSDQSIELRNL